MITTGSVAFRALGQDREPQTRLTTTYERMANLPALQQYLTAFPKATGVTLRLEPPNVLARVPCVVSVAIVLGRSPVATFVTGLVATKEQSEGLRQLLELCAQDLATRYIRQLLQSVPAEPPCVTRAREYILAHVHEPLTIPAIAKHVSYCADHFGKVFHKHTGLTLGEYITRTRVERAKELLANPHLRITDVAFEAGFQSLPTFNRAFHQHTGQAAKAWRSSLGI